MAPVVVEHPSSTEKKGTINLRIDARDRRLIDEAAALLGRTRTDLSSKAPSSYLRCAELIEYPAESRTLFLSVKTIVAALE